MQCYIDRFGVLTITGDNPTEDYALIQWANNNVEVLDRHPNTGRQRFYKIRNTLMIRGNSLPGQELMHPEWPGNKELTS